MEARCRKVLVFLVPPLQPSTKTDPLSPPPVPGITPEQYQSSQRRRRPERTWTFSPRSDLPTWLNRLPGVEPGTIQALPVYSYGGGKEKFEIKDCAICLGEFEENEAVKEIPFCKHVFHPHCIDRWLWSHVACPVCRSFRLFDDEGVSQSNSAITRSTAGNQDECV
ncbi:RING-H2 finger protein ATL57-like [Juglans regia]|uniref:RING-type E3 ubiquitin transferase n=1 Tax=Juglans regia TaxID=51240 RepID=A0A2I4FQ00_JUGRE|nr:RING-H2 finger protein ATL57-like [Juglans regia]